jgi:hypothetical protein
MQSLAYAYLTLRAKSPGEYVEEHRGDFAGRQRKARARCCPVESMRVYSGAQGDLTEIPTCGSSGMTAEDEEG